VRFSKVVMLRATALAFVIGVCGQQPKLIAGPNEDNRSADPWSHRNLGYPPSPLYV